MQGMDEDEDVALQVASVMSACMQVVCSLLDFTSVPAESLSEEPEAASSQSHTRHACLT